MAGRCVDFRRDEGGYVALLDPAERRVLLDVVDGVIDLLDDGPVPPPDGPDPLAALVLPAHDMPAPDDPALRRLLPDASDDPEIAAELRRLTEADLRAARSAELRRLTCGARAGRAGLVVVPGEAADVAAALTDVRLVLASRLGLETDEEAEAVYALAAAHDRAGRRRGGHPQVPRLGVRGADRPAGDPPDVADRGPRRSWTRAPVRRGPSPSRRRPSPARRRGSPGGPPAPTARRTTRRGADGTVAESG